MQEDTPGVGVSGTESCHEGELVLHDNKNIE